jgi:hypothetical protein
LGLLVQELVELGQQGWRHLLEGRVFRISWLVTHGAGVELSCAKDREAGAQGELVEFYVLLQALPGPPIPERLT